MKHCKNVLALVLVIATLLSFTLVAGAAKVQYTDADEITHQAAVNLLSGVGVINGYEDGSFEPESSVTRAEMAKILAFVLNGGADVGESYSAACTFADSRNHWAKGYIGFCVSAGLINGKSANTFDPDGEVTGYEVSKMLLCALGYKADLNGLTGAQWNANAHSLAIKTNLLAGLVEYAPAEPMNRDDSCQMILNALKTTMVETTGTVTSIGAVTITKDVANVELSNNASDYTGTVDGKLQLVEDVFPTLKLVSGTTNDPFGRPATEWRFKGVSLGIDIMKPLLTTNTTMKASAIATAIGDAPVRSAQVFVNGTDLGTITVEELTAATGLSLAKIKGQNYDNTSTAIYNSFPPATGESRLMTTKNFPASLLAQVLIGYKSNIRYSDSSSETDDGSSRATYTFHTEAFFDAATGKVTLINNSYYLGQVASICDAVTDDDGNVTYPGYILVKPDEEARGKPPKHFADIEVNDSITIPGGAQAPVLMDDIVYSEDDDALKIGDYVIFNVGCNDHEKTDNADKTNCYIENVTPMQRITITVARTTRLKSNGVLRSYDNVYDENDVLYYPADDLGYRDTHDVGDTYDLIVAKFGSRNYYYKTEDPTGNYMYLYNADHSQNALTGEHFEAKLVKSDGSVEIVETDRLYRDYINHVVTATTNAAGKTVLTSVGDYSIDRNLPVKVENSNSTVTFDSDTKIADTNTRFVISQVDGKGNETFTVYTGIHKVPDIQSGELYAYVTNAVTDVLDTVFILNATGVTSSRQEGVVFKVGGKDLQFTGEGGVAYYQLPAIMNGEVTTAKITKSAYENLGADGFHLFNSYTTDAYGNMDIITQVDGTPITQFTPAAAGNIFINNTPMTYHDNVLVYTYSLLKQTLEVSTVEALNKILTDNTFTSYYTLHEDYPNKPLAAIFAIIP